MVDGQAYPSRDALVGAMDPRGSTPYTRRHALAVNGCKLSYVAFDEVGGQIGAISPVGSTQRRPSSGGAKDPGSANPVVGGPGLHCCSGQPTGDDVLGFGRLFLRAWVRLNMSAYGVQVMANPSIHVFQHVVGIIPEDYPAESKQAFAEGERILARAFGLPEGEIPAWMFRTGRSTALPPKMRTLRRPLSSVVRILNDC